jgi:hypothetical protein
MRRLYGAVGHHAGHGVLQTFVVVAGTLSMSLGEPPAHEIAELPPSAV